MIRYTTPTYSLRVVGCDLTDMTVYVTFEQRGVSLTIDNPTIELVEGDTLVTCSMTQEQSAEFSSGVMEVQINWIDALGNRCATVAKQIPVVAQLLREVI